MPTNGINLWTPLELMAIRQDDRLQPVPSYFLDTYFTETHYSREFDIIMAELPIADRKMAPFVAPWTPGKPVVEYRGTEVKAFRPAYVKMKDAVRPSEARQARPLELLNGNILDMQQRFDQRTAEIVIDHSRKYEMRLAWMAARSFIDGKYTFRYNQDQGMESPVVTLDFGRDAGHYVIKTSGYWDNTSTPILDDIQTWMDVMFNAKYGGQPNRIILGSQVAASFNKNQQLIGQMDQTVRGNQVNILTGLQNRAQPLNYMGSLMNNGGMEVYSYKDTVQDPAGNHVDILDPKEILLIAPGATGVQCYGAIDDVKAMVNGEYASTKLFGSMFYQEDPSAILVAHQGSPLMIPMYPNRTFRARVLA